jgi:hypothetical protein
LRTKIAAENSGRHGKIVRYDKLVAGAGFERAVRPLPDYELLRYKPVIA